MLRRSMAENYSHKNSIQFSFVCFFDGNMVSQAQEWDFNMEPCRARDEKRCCHTVSAAEKKQKPKHEAILKRSCGISKSKRSHKEKKQQKLPTQKGKKIFCFWYCLCFFPQSTRSLPQLQIQKSNRSQSLLEEDE
jgi:hypothetical protein